MSYIFLIIDFLHYLYEHVYLLLFLVLYVDLINNLREKNTLKMKLSLLKNGDIPF